MRLVNELLFWLHLALLGLALIAGFFLPLPIIIILALIHRLQMIVCNGCLVSRLQTKLGGLPAEYNFIQYAIQRFFRRTTTPLQGKLLDYGLVSFSLVIAAINQYH